MTPGLSAEVFAIPLESGRHIVYAPLRRAAFVANANAVNVLADLQEGRAPEGAQAPELIELLRRLQIVDGGPEPLPVTTFEGQPEPTSITLFLTTVCNLRCTYCYASAGDTPARSMRLEVAQRGIDFVAANAVRKGLATFEINYHGGGEPTANWRVMTESLEYARRTAERLDLEPPRASSASNGVLSDSQIDWIIANIDGGVSVSFDGLPSAHDRHRLTVLGQPSSGRVMHTLRRFDEAGYPYGVRLTVTADLIAQLEASVDFVCTHFKTTRIQVEPAYQLGRWREAPSAETDAFIDAYRRAQRRAAAHGRDIFFSAARMGQPANHFCGVTQDTFALSPDGNVSACYEVFSEDNRFSDVFFYGRPDEGRGYQFDLRTLDRLRGQAVQSREYCQGCFAKWTCSGDCYHKAIDVTGSLEFAGTDRCHITRELTKDLILERIAAAGGLFWHEADGDSGAPARGKEVLL
jgi:uncharacterized protein